MTITKSTIVVYEYSGSTSELTVPFDYLKRDFVVVALGGDGKPQKALKLGTDYIFATKTTIVITRQYQPEEGYNKVIIRRVTDASKRIINYQDGSILNASELNTSQLQALHVAEEARDLANYTLFVDDNNNLDARGRKIINLGDPTNPQDAVTKKYVDTASESVIDSRDKALEYRNEAEEFKNQSQGFRNEAEAAKNEAIRKASEISSKIDKADQLNEQALVNSNKAQQYATTAQQSASAASLAEKNAKASDKNATISAEKAKSYADSLLPETFVKTVETVEALKGSSYHAGTVVKVLGYYSKDDKATHTRVIGADNDGTGIQLSNGLYANILCEDYIHIDWLGAKGDGITDDSSYFTLVFNILKDKSYKLVLGYNKSYIINTKLHYTFNTQFNIEGNGATLDFNHEQQLGYYNRVGPCIKLTCSKPETDGYNLTIKNLKVTAKRYAHTDSTTEEDCNQFGGLNLADFHTVEIDNLIVEAVSFGSGLAISGYTQCDLSNLIFTDCGRKFSPVGDSTSRLDAGGDAIYLARYNKEARCTINNLYAKSWVGKYGRCGIALERPRVDGNRHSLTVSNFKLIGYHRAIHQEDRSSTMNLHFVNGHLEDFAAGYFITGGKIQIQAIFDNVYFKNCALDYGSNNGVAYAYDVSITPKIVMNNCYIDYDYKAQNPNTDIVFNKCIINFKNQIRTPHSFSTYNDSTLTFTEGSQYYVITGSIVTFNRCNIIGTKSGDKNLFIQDSTLTFNSTSCLNFGVTAASMRKPVLISKCEFKYDTYGSDRLLQGSNTEYHVTSSSIINTTDSLVRLYGDGNVIFKKIVNSYLENVQVDIIGSKSMRELHSNTFVSKFDFFKYYSPSYRIYNSSFKKTTTIADPKQANSGPCYIFNSWVTDELGVTKFINNNPNALQTLNTPTYMYMMEQEGIKDEFLEYNKALIQYNMLKNNEDSELNVLSLIELNEPEVPQRIKDFVEEYDVGLL